MCRNWKIWALFTALAAGIVATTPIAFSIAPLLILAACPLMMIIGGGLAYRGTQRVQHDPVERRSDPAPDRGRALPSSHLGDDPTAPTLRER